MSEIDTTPDPTDHQPPNGQTPTDTPGSLDPYETIHESPFLSTADQQPAPQMEPDLPWAAAVGSINAASAVSADSVDRPDNTHPNAETNQTPDSSNKTPTTTPAQQPLDHDPDDTDRTTPPPPGPTTPQNTEPERALPSSTNPAEKNEDPTPHPSTPDTATKSSKAPSAPPDQPPRARVLTENRIAVREEENDGTNSPTATVPETSSMTTGLPEITQGQLQDRWTSSVQHDESSVILDEVNEQISDDTMGESMPVRADLDSIDTDEQATLAPGSGNEQTETSEDQVAIETVDNEIYRNHTEPSVGFGGKQHGIDVGADWPIRQPVRDAIQGQITNEACVSACGSQLTEIPQKELIIKIGQPADFGQLQWVVNIEQPGSGWRAGSINPTAPDAHRTVEYLSGTGQWAAEVVNNGTRHAVVIMDYDSTAGVVTILDPWNDSTVNDPGYDYRSPTKWANFAASLPDSSPRMGSSYQVDLSDFLKYWDGNLFFRP